MDIWSGVAMAGFIWRPIYRMKPEPEASNTLTMVVKANQRTEDCKFR